MNKTISINLDQARIMYKSNSEDLKKLALSVFSKNELESLNERDISFVVKQATNLFKYPLGYDKIITLFIRILTVAKYFNEDWERTNSNTGYFITPVSVKINNVKTYQFGVRSHCSVIHPGIIYFRRYDDAMYTIKILNLNKYLNPKTCQIMAE